MNQVTLATMKRAGAEILGVLVRSNRSGVTKKGKVIRVGKRDRVDIRWPDGVVSTNQYTGDYSPF